MEQVLREVQAKAFAAGFFSAMRAVVETYGDPEVIREMIDDWGGVDPEDLSRDALIAVGADDYDAEEIAALLEDREPDHDCFENE